MPQLSIWNIPQYRQIMAALVNPVPVGYIKAAATTILILNLFSSANQWLWSWLTESSVNFLYTVHRPVSVYDRFISFCIFIYQQLDLRLCQPIKSLSAQCDDDLMETAITSIMSIQSWLPPVCLFDCGNLPDAITWLCPPLPLFETIQVTCNGCLSTLVTSSSSCVHIMLLNLFHYELDWWLHTGIDLCKLWLCW